jgi:hypothetical protein
MTLSDADEVIALGIEFAEKSKSIHKMKVSKSRIEEFTMQNILNPKIIAIVLEVDGKIEGFAWGIITDTYFSEDRIFQEMTLYSRKAKGGLALIDALEDEASKAGVDGIVMGNKPGYADLSKIYRRKGYSLMEEHHIKTGV